jgi:hypothetical protein
MMQATYDKKVGRGYFNEEYRDIILKYISLPIGQWHVFKVFNVASFKSAHLRYLKANKLTYIFRFEHVEGNVYRVKRVS